MACPGCAAVAEGKPMPPPWRNPQAVTSTLSDLLLVVGFFGAQLDLPALAYPAITLAYETERSNGELQQAFTAVLILSKDIGDFNLTANLSQSASLSGDEGIANKTSLGIRYPRHGIRWSLEYKDLGPTQRYLLPAVQLPLRPGMSLKLGVGKGLNDQSPEYLAGALLELEFGEEAND